MSINDSSESRQRTAKSNDPIRSQAVLIRFRITWVLFGIAFASVTAFYLWGFNPLVEWVGNINQHSEILQLRVAQLEIAQKRMETSTTFVAPTPQAVPTQASAQKYSVVTTYSGYLLGNGSYLLKMAAKADPNGNYSSLEDAQGYIDSSLYMAKQACVTSGYAEKNTLSFFESYNFQKRVTPDCWNQLYVLTGIWPKDHLPLEKVKYLQNNVGFGATDSDVNLFFDDDGYQLGYWQNSPLPGPGTKECLDLSLRAIGWRGQAGYFAVGQHDAWDTLYNEGLAARGPKIPDLCGIANLKPVIQPDWLDVSRQTNGIFTLKTVKTPDPLTVWIHTDPDTDPAYPQGWEKGRYLIEIQDKQLKATVGEHELVAIDVYLRYATGLKTNLAVYFFLDHGLLSWFEGQPTGWPQVLDVATLVISPWIDGTAPWVDYGNGTYYTIRGNGVTKQNPAKEWKTQ